MCWVRRAQHQELVQMWTQFLCRQDTFKRQMRRNIKQLLSYAKAQQMKGECTVKCCIARYTNKFSYLYYNELKRV